MAGHKKRWSAPLAALIGGSVYLLFFWPLRDPRPAVPAVHGALAIREAKIWFMPQPATAAEAPRIEERNIARGADLLGGTVARHMAMIPTLKMFATTVTANPAYLEPIYSEVRQFHALGGELLFGTDVGYLTDYRTEDEFRALTQCGLNARDILRMLTTAPARRFGVAGQKGSIAPGKLADPVVLSRDPERDISALARVRFTVRNGRLVYGQ